jgi:hypothetical protein
MTEKLDRFLAWLWMNLDALAIGAIVAAALVCLMLVARSIGRRIVSNDPNCVGWRGVVGRVLAKTSILFMAAAALEIVVSYAQRPASIRRIFDITFIIAIACRPRLGRELILGVVGSHAGEKPAKPRSAMPWASSACWSASRCSASRSSSSSTIWASTSPALGRGLGIGGIAIGLAAQGIFSDLFAALAILFDRPFRRGDTIRFDPHGGTVEKIGLKTTRLTSLTASR